MSELFDNKDLYPTPDDLIEKMLDGTDLKMVNHILEPEAGTGKIVDYLLKKGKDLYYNRNYDIDCIENDKNLQHILKGKNHRVIHDDFLTFDTMKQYDLIIMNPPFSQGAKHLLKAISLQEKYGGAIISIINAETLRKVCTNERKVLAQKLEQYNADIKYYQNAFTNAVRKTDVEIAIVKILIPKREPYSFLVESLQLQTKEVDEFSQPEYTQLMESDFLKSIVSQYQFEIELGISLIREYQAMQPYILSYFETDKNAKYNKDNCILNLDLSKNAGNYSNRLSINEYIKEVRRKYWTALFSNDNFVGQLTTDLQEQFRNKVSDLVNYDFSLYNIYTIKIEMTQHIAAGIEQTIINLFEELSNKYHWYDATSQNIRYFNGWKTNKSYIVNKKVVIPLSSRSFTGRYEPSNYRVVTKLRDIERCFNYLSGSSNNGTLLYDKLRIAENTNITKNIELKYFNVTFYKKGTCHITFKDEELLKKFNIFGSQKKNWLPPCYGKKKYKDMTDEEKTVIDEFEGESSYNNVLNKKDYFITETVGNNYLECKLA